ncbi:winged helix-turn-helix domain-containing protein [Bradyrhizobium lablabi]|uniref:winged helix-turn-helix domain-containing tetratricopeptide repeat protein n=1 Tax=Bradyrhizobium lablabi TaxID=722472 RepID=UPI001BAE552F|nr:winged helix-turn-helix domain-containing tetratricopeptide repeat protein [Bradyrhizobium lablabi]MBR1120459.1 winged helix-turn-helix domain-containing protein [Bradyrhizobium lablabi]
MRYLFEDYALDTDQRELHRASDIVPVAPQVFDLLEYLIRNREQVVSRDDLLNAVWNGRIVSEAALTTRLNAARSAIGDSGEQQRLIKTLPRKGFRFVGPVQEVRRRPAASVQDELAWRTGNGSAVRPTAPRLSIVVLPFANIGAGPEQDYFVDGVTESLTTDLSRIAGSFVIARNTAFTFKGRAVDVKLIGRELNVRYVLEGSVQRGGNRFRLNAQLIDAETGNHLWAERFDKPAADLFDMQDEIVSRLANTLNAELIEVEARRAERSPHPDAMDLYFQGRASINKALTPASIERARNFFARALALDPENIEAAVSAAHLDMALASGHLTDDGILHLDAAESALIRVLSLAPNYPRAHMFLGAVRMQTRRIAEGIAACNQALALDRNLADAHGFIGFGKYLMGRIEEVEAHIQEALRLSPRDTRTFIWFMFAGMARFAAGADLESIAWFRRSLESNRNHPHTHFQLAAALALAGDVMEARSTALAGLAFDPGFTIRRYRVNARSDNPIYLATRERFYAGMRIAGLPEG